MFGIIVFGIFFGVPALLLYFGRSTLQVYFLSWVILVVVLIAHALLRGAGDLGLSLLSAVASSVLSFAFTSLVLFGHWMIEQARSS